MARHRGERKDDVEDVPEQDAEVEDEALGSKLVDLLNTFHLRQSEILRLALFMEERRNEISGASARARDIILPKLGSGFDPKTLDELMCLLDESIVIPEESVDKGELRREARIQAIAEVLKEIPEGEIYHYLDGVRRALGTPPADELLLSSLLVSLVGEFEMFLNQSARACVQRRPRAIYSKNLSLTGEDLERHDSVDSIREALVDHVIADVFRGPYLDWLKFLEQRFAVPIPALASEGSVQELFQRRHCIVHYGGFASHTYVTKTQFLDLSVEVGEALSVDIPYLRESADRLAALAAGVAWNIGLKFLHGSTYRSEFVRRLGDHTFTLLQDVRDRALIYLEPEVPFEDLREDERVVPQVNVWLAYKNEGRIDEVVRQVEDFDAGSYGTRAVLAKLVLQGKISAAYHLVKAMAFEGEIALYHVETWPLLEEVRAYAYALQGSRQEALDL